MNLLVPIAKKLPPAMRPLAKAIPALPQAKTPEGVIEIERALDSLETYMRNAGMLFDDAEVRLVNETRMTARWRLGQLLAKVERGKAGRHPKNMSVPQTHFRSLLDHLKLDKQVALEAQRIGALPKTDLMKTLQRFAKTEGDYCTFAELVREARPWWYQASRKRKHKIIREEAAASQQLEVIGPFPLIYADPPWRFEIYSEKGQERTPDQHYPTMSLEEICEYEINGKTMDEIAHRDAALLLWCTSSNLPNALKVMDAWGFDFKSSAVWVKDRTGLGLVFRNRHELILYGTRGNMPGPQYQPPSVFEYPRGRHSAKPAAIREEIEKMYPDFGRNERLELFAREEIQGWTVHGFEAFAQAAE